MQLLNGNEDHKWMATKPMRAALKANGRPLYRSSYKKVRLGSYSALTFSEETFQID